MKDISNSNFGLLIAYALPGFVVVWALDGAWAPLAVCSDASCNTAASMYSFFNTTIASLAAGMGVSAIRYVMIDSLYSALGISRPDVDGTRLQANLGAVSTSIEQHYRYYQFHANMLVAGLIAYGVHLYRLHTFPGLLELLLLGMAGIFWLTARDNLTKYYRTLTSIFSPYTSEIDIMSNGMSHEHKAAKPQPKRETAEAAERTRREIDRDTKADQASIQTANNK
jgi:hypothetical protein